VANIIAKTWRHYRAQRGVPRELFMLVVALLVGALVVPLLIWSGGQLVLGPYARDAAGLRTGGPFALLADFFHGLAVGSPGYWIVLLGPYVLYLVLRISRRLLRA
jgi:hypothetical protein